MHTKGIWSLILAITLMLTVVGIASAAETEASITFFEGGLTWEDTGETGLDQRDISFGSRRIPTGTVSYSTTNAPHALYVEDAREYPDGWNVKVRLSIFEGQASSFSGKIVFADGVANSAGVTIPGEVTLLSGAGDVRIMAADPVAGRGMFEGAWSEADQVTLQIAEAEALLVNVDTYAATLTWTLAAGPV